MALFRVRAQHDQTHVVGVKQRNQIRGVARWMVRAYAHRAMGGASTSGGEGGAVGHPAEGATAASWIREDKRRFGADSKQVQALSDRDEIPIAR